MSFKPNGSPPPYESENNYHPPPPSQPAYSYYPDDEFQHFYRWSSPPGILKIMAVLAIVLCVGIFACVASTLAWDTQGDALGGFGGIGYGGGSSYGTNYGGGGYSSFGGGAYGAGSSYGYLGGNYYNPRTAKGFIIAMAAMVFIFSLAVFVVVVSHQRTCHSRRFYLAVMVLCAILALLMLIASIVYLMAVNPMGQSYGSMYGAQISGLCSQYQQPQLQGPFVNQYLYHYCVVEPQEAIAVVCGFFVTAALIVMLVFALKTRQKINNYGKDNILWRKVKVLDDVTPPQDVEAWVNDVSTVPQEHAISDYPLKSAGSRNYLDDNSTSYDKPPYSDSPGALPEHSSLLHSSAPYSSSEVSSSVGKNKKKRPGRPRRVDGQDNETDYNSSGDELDDDDFDSEFPPIASDDGRVAYKREFDQDHQEFRGLQVELDAINKSLSEVDRKLDDLQEGSPEYNETMEEYYKLKDLKRSADYQMKKRRCKYLKSKLSHIKKMVADYDRKA